MEWNWIDQPIQWLTDPSWTMFWSVFIYTWAHLGFYMLILLAGLQSIPKDLYEAAEMDGTSDQRAFWRITLPLLMPILLVVTVLSLIKAFQAFEELFALQVGWISLVSYIFETAGLRGQKTTFGLGIAAMASLLVALLLILLSLLQFYLTEGRLNFERCNQIFSRTHGKNKLSFIDWIAYLYLFLGFLIIFLPVLWLLLNSIKSQFLLQKLDTNLLPLDYDRVVRATVFGPDGKEIFIIKDLPDWVIYWNELRDEDKKEVNDPNLFLTKFEGKEYYALRTHLGLVSDHAKKLIEEKNFPEWLIKYPSMFPDAKKEYNPEEYLVNLNEEEVRLLSEFLGLKPYKPNGFTSQILISAKNKENNEIEEYSVSRLNTNKDTVNARLISNPQGVLLRFLLKI